MIGQNHERAISRTIRGGRLGKSFESLAFAAIVILSIGSSLPMAAAKSAPSPNTYIKGIYNCQLEGSFITNPFSSALVQFQVDGAGNVVRTLPGEFAATLGGFNTPQGQTAPNSFSGAYAKQKCDYTVASGNYSLNSS